MAPNRRSQSAGRGRFISAASSARGLRSEAGEQARAEADQGHAGHQQHGSDKGGRGERSPSTSRAVRMPTAGTRRLKGATSEAG